MNNGRWEYGSEFPLMQLRGAPSVTLPEPARWYSLGRHAVRALAPYSSGRLWLPCYFCPEVTSYWAQNFRIERYCDTPQRQAPDWSTLRPATSDLVVAVNFFGARDMSCWSAWRQGTDCVLVEDYTHNVSCPAISTSDADYGFASLRKTFAVPDGAILWSPRKLALPASLTTSARGAELKLAAMALKFEYLAGRRGSELKLAYRQMQVEGERQLAESAPATASAYTMEVLRPGFPAEWQIRRRKNVLELIGGCAGNRNLEPLFVAWPKGATPFAPVVVFGSRGERDAFRTELRHHNIYCPIHWEVDGECADANDLAGRILTIPADQRYGSQDVQHVLQALSHIRATMSNPSRVLR